MKIPFSPPFVDQSVIDEVTDSIKSGWITTGPKVKAFEAELAKLSQIENVVCVNSWTSAAIMVLKWLDLNEGDEVILPAYTYSATALAVIHAGGIPVIVDVDTDFNISLERIKANITSKTKAIIPVDFAGWPCDYDEIMNLVKEDAIVSIFKPNSENQKKIGRIMVLSDAAHSIGAIYKDRPAASYADITTYSFHAVKNITTAEGGAVVINLPKPFDNAEVYKEMRLMTLNCQTKDAFTKTQGSSWKYDIIGLGLKINMPDINAAFGLAQIRQYDDILSQRKNIFYQYVNHFKDNDWAIMSGLKSLNKESSYHLLPLRVKNINQEQRDEMIKVIQAKGVSVNVHFVPLPLLTFFKDKTRDGENYKQAIQNFSAEISLPIYPGLTHEQISYIYDAVVEAYQKIIIHEKAI
jgi:dTDP-4-amino-4,6-dideoxygalactose transaminase